MKRVFVIKLEVPAHVSDPIRELRWILKRLLRSYGFRCIDIRQEHG